MKRTFTRATLAAIAFSFVFVSLARAEDKKVTLKGTITCAKCDLGVESKCATVIKVKEAGKLRLESRDYVMRDGDMIHIRFKV